jgi:hypothetical protein
VDISSDVAQAIVVTSYIDMSSDVAHFIVMMSYMDMSSDVAHRNDITKIACATSEMTYPVLMSPQ